MIHCLFGLTLAEWIFKCYVCILAILSSWKRAQLTTIRKKEIERKKNPKRRSWYMRKILMFWVACLLVFFSYLVRAFDSHAEDLCSNPGHNGQSCLQRYMWWPFHCQMLGNGREYLYESSDKILKMDVPRHSSCVARWNGNGDTRMCVSMCVKNSRAGQ